MTASGAGGFFIGALVLYLAFWGDGAGFGDCKLARIGRWGVMVSCSDQLG